MPYFICPSCAWRGTRTSRTVGFSDRPAACERCGFGFLHELLDDYFPSARAGIFVCDAQARIIALGRGARELCGYNEQQLMGQEIGSALELAYTETTDSELPHVTALEWGARVMNKELSMVTEAGKQIEVVGDFLPAYDDDGGLLAIFTPKTGD